MDVAQLIAKLQKLDPETLVVKMRPVDGYDEVHFVVGSHEDDHLGVDASRLMADRSKFVKGAGKPDYQYTRLGGTRAKTFPFVVLD